MTSTFFPDTACFRSEVISTASGILIPGSFEHSRDCRMCSASVSRCDQSVTSFPFSLSRIASAVPQLPAPITPIFSIVSPPLCRCPAQYLQFISMSRPFVRQPALLHSFLSFSTFLLTAFYETDTSSVLHHVPAARYLHGASRTRARQAQTPPHTSHSDIAVSCQTSRFVRRQ